MDKLLRRTDRFGPGRRSSRESATAPLRSFDIVHSYAFATAKRLGVDRQLLLTGLHRRASYTRRGLDGLGLRVAVVEYLCIFF